MKYGMIKLKSLRNEDIPQIIAWESERETKDFIIPYSYDKHLRNMSDPAFIYLSIVENNTMIGFIILVLDDDGTSVEFRRIVLARKNKGRGQKAVTLMEKYCKTELKRTRIWLDVFDYNEKARHIYDKLGYKQFDRTAFDGRTLLLYEKELRS